MSFQNTAPCFLTFYHSDQSLLLFYIQNFILNINLFTFYITLCSWYDCTRIMHGYITVEPLYIVDNT